MAGALPPSTRLGGLGALGTAVVLTVFAGLPGALAGLAVVAAWAAVADTAAFAVGTVAVGALVAAGSIGAGAVDPTRLQGPVADAGGPVVSVGILAVPLVLLLLGTGARAGRPIAVAGLILLLSGGLGAIAVAPLLAGGTVLVGATTLLLAVAITTYGLHRVGLLVSGVLQHG